MAALGYARFLPEFLSRPFPPGFQDTPSPILYLLSIPFIRISPCSLSPGSGTISGGKAGGWMEESGWEEGKRKWMKKKEEEGGGGGREKEKREKQEKVTLHFLHTSTRISFKSLSLLTPQIPLPTHPPSHLLSPPSAKYPLHLIF